MMINTKILISWVVLLSILLLGAAFDAKAATGLASWYGPGFHGKKTANGETYNMYALTAASKTLPLGSWVKVTNLDNNKQVTVKINDRGPYVGIRILDLSYEAAKRLGIIAKGTGHIKIE